jgi:hypothetical protein
MTPPDAWYEQIVGYIVASRTASWTVPPGRTAKQRIPDEFRRAERSRPPRVLRDGQPARRKLIALPYGEPHRETCRYQAMPAQSDLYAPSGEDALWVPIQDTVSARISPAQNVLFWCNIGHYSPHLMKDKRVGQLAAASNVEIAYTPTNSSWLNRVETQFTALRYIALDGTDHVSHEELDSMIRRYIIWRNNHAYDERLRRIVARANVA